MMLSVKHTYTAKKESGAFLVELAIITPILLFLVLTCLEFSMYLKIRQNMSDLVRQSANNAYRQCSPYSTPTSCLEAVVNQMNNYAVRALPGAEIVLSVYEYQSASGTVIRRGIGGVDQATLLTPSGNTSNFNPNRVSSSLTTANANTPVIVVSEAFYDSSNFAGGQFFTNFLGIFYEIMVF